MKIKIIVGTFFIILIIFLLLTSIYIRKDRLDNENINLKNNPEEVSGVTDFNNYPSLLNIPPANAYLNSEYIFDCYISDTDSNIESLKVEIEEGPRWLAVNGLRLYGTPEESDLGNNKVKLKISDETHSVLLTYYILVTRDVEEK